MFKDIQPNIVIHLAAVSHANKSNKDPYNTFDHSLRDVLKNCFTFKGLKVDDARFDVPQSLYNWANPHVNIRKYELNSIGKLKPSKERQIFCQENPDCKDHPLESMQ